MSLVPGVTEMLFAIGAGPSVVGVSSYDDFPAEVRALPKVGALLDPDSEGILALRPDLVIVYGSQTAETARFTAAGIQTFSYRHSDLAGVLETIAALGAITGRPDDATRLVGAIRQRMDAIEACLTGRPHPRTMLVFDRTPGTLRGLYAAGGTGFMHDMLTMAGGDNVFADTRREAVQPTHEAILTRAPEIVIDVSAVAREAGPVARERAEWSRLASVPAVRHGRLLRLEGRELVVPGPRVADGIAALARAMHPDVTCPAVTGTP